MPDTQAERVQMAATLELEGGVCVAGKLSPMADGKLQMGSTRLVKGSGTTGRISLKPGTSVTLLITPEDAGEPDKATVTIAGISGNNIALEFADPDCSTAARYRAQLAKTPEQPRPATAGANEEFNKLLLSLQQNSLKRLENVLHPFFLDLKGHLLDLSTRVKQSVTGENRHYEASVIVRGKSPAIIAAFIDQIADYFNDLTPAPEEEQRWQEDIRQRRGLDLVDIQEFEDFLALDRMITVGQQLHHIALEALTLRVAKLIDKDPHTVRLPIHIRQLCRALQPALIGQNMPREVFPHVFDFFAKEFINQLGNYYASLNTLLEREGICPGVEQEIEAKGSLLKEQPASPKPRPKPPPAPATSQEQTDGTVNAGDVAAAPPVSAPVYAAGPGPAAEVATGGMVGEAPIGAVGPRAEAADAQRALTQPAATSVQSPHAESVYRQFGGEASGATSRFSPQNLYSSVINALNFKRAAEGLAESSVIDSGAPLSGTWDGAAVAASEVDRHSLADSAAIARALESIQQDEEVRSELQQTTSLREYLAEHKQQFGELKDTRGLTAESLNQLDMVDNLFGTIRSQLDVAPQLQPALENLQVPLAKLALLDPQFMQDRSHSARGVVDKLTQLASSANFPNRALENRVNGIVEDIVEHYESDTSVFDGALENIEKLIVQQERALSRNVERVVRTQDGQEKLKKARVAVDAVIDGIIQPPAAPKVLVDLVDKGWRDLLVLTHIKEGPQSERWKEHIQTLELLQQWLGEKNKGLDDETMLQRTMEAETLIDRIGGQIDTALPTNSSHDTVLQEMRDILSGNNPVETVQIGQETSEKEKTPEEARARIEDLPRLRRWVKRVEQLEKDSWLTYRDKDGSKRRMQLAWISEAHDRFIFVNERGQKVADLSSVQLARQLSRGVQPPPPADKLSVVDQSMYQTLEQVQKTLSFARNHDALTKLINRETFENQLERTLRHAQVKRSEHAVLYLDIDQFSLVNDVYDTVNGDQVLLEFAKLLAQLHGKKSSSARMESDEFAVLLLDRNIEQAVKMAEKIRSDIQAGSVDIEGEQVGFTVSIGVAPIAEHSPDIRVILETARAAVRLAKEQGGNNVVQFEEDQESATKFRKNKTRTLKHLEETLATERFVLRAQPIVQTSVTGSPESDNQHHYELLLGLSNNDGELVSPEDFIRSAERYGFMTLVDRWVVREAFSWISQLMDAQKVIPSLAINLSGTSVSDDTFMEYLFEQISEFGVGTSRLCFEITETGTISNLVKAADFVRAFRNIGCKFSIDDFGTGLASHNYLRELPVDYVKIDGTFVTNIHENRSDYAMTRSINDLAHFLGQETIAESVEHEEIIDTLREIGVDFLQGWGIGKPKVLSEVTQDLSSVEK